MGIGGDVTPEALSRLRQVQQRIVDSAVGQTDTRPRAELEVWTFGQVKRKKWNELNVG